MTERPILTFDGAYLVGELPMPAWALPGGKVPVAGIEIHSPEGDVPLSPGRAAALDVLLAEPERIRTATLEALFARYGERAGVSTLEAFAEKVTPSEIALHDEGPDGVGCIGLSFGCPWDREHGLGVMLHGTRVLRAGEADTALLGWIARSEEEVRAQMPAGVAKKSKPRDPSPKRPIAAAAAKRAPKPAPVKVKKAKVAKAKPVAKKAKAQKRR